MENHQGPPELLAALHVPTLLLATALVVGVAGLLLILSTEGGRAARAFAMWGAAMLAGSVGLGLLAAGRMLGGWADLMGAATILGGTALSWGAARRFAGREVMPGMLVLGPAVYLAAAIERERSSTVASVVVLTAGGIYTLAAAWELWRSRETKLRVRDAAMVLMAVHGLLHFGRGLSLAWAPSHPILSAPVVSAALMLESLAHTVAMALLLLALLKEQTLADRLEEARMLALMDGLTGLGNRRHFDESIEREAARAVRDGRKLALLMIDADHFKRINDVFGHAAGDDCLKSTAQAIRSALHRPGDAAARFGGEEFAVLLADTDEPGAEAVAGAIHDAVAALRLPHPSAPGGFVTVSIGVAVLSPGLGSSRPDALLRAADSALYAAKALGRNRTEVAGAPAPGESLARPIA